MIALFVPTESDRAAEIEPLLKWAADCIDCELARPIELRLAGIACRLAFEFSLRELCRRHSPPKGDKWHNFAIRLLKCGAFTMDDYRHVRRIARLGAYAVHGKPWDRFRAKLLLEMVSAFVEGSQHAI